MSTARRINTDLGFIPMKTLEQLKSNAELIVGDYVAVAETCLFYKIQSESTTIRLNNGLYADEIKHRELVTENKNLVGAVNELVEELKKKLNLTGGTITGDIVMSGASTITTSYNYGIKGTKKDGTTNYIMYIDDVGRLHIGCNNSFPIFCDGELTATKVHNPVWG